MNEIISFPEFDKSPQDLFRTTIFALRKGQNTYQVPQKIDYRTETAEKLLFN